MPVSTPTAEQMFREAEKHDGRYLLPHRFHGNDTDPLYDTAKELVHSGHARWLPTSSTYSPGIRLTGKPWDGAKCGR